MRILARSASSAVILLAGIAGASGLAMQDAAPRKADADQLAAKIARIQAIAETPPDGARAPVRTLLTEAEVNAYLFWNGDAVLPAGLTDPHIRMSDGGQVSADAIVDLTAIRDQRERGWLDPLAYVGGRVTVAASGVIRAREGLGTIELSSVTVGGVSVPKSILQELVSYYTRSPESPNGVSLDDPIRLPASIRELVVGRGEAVVIQ